MLLEVREVAVDGHPEAEAAGGHVEKRPVKSTRGLQRVACGEQLPAGDGGRRRGQRLRLAKGGDRQAQQSRCHGSLHGLRLPSTGVLAYSPIAVFRPSMRALTSGRVSLRKRSGRKRVSVHSLTASMSMSSSRSTWAEGRKSAIASSMQAGSGFACPWPRSSASFPVS